MFGLDLDMASVRRDIDGYMKALTEHREAVEVNNTLLDTNNALLARLIEIEEQK